MTWTIASNLLVNSSGFKAKAKLIDPRVAERQVSSNSIVAEYQGTRWRITMVSPPARNKTGMDEMRYLQEARDWWVAMRRADVNPFPED